MNVHVTGGMTHQECADWAGGTPCAVENRMGDIESELALAARYVAEARRIVARQRVRTVRLQALRQSTPDQDLTLEAFVGALALLEGHARQLADTAKELGPPQRKLS